MQISKVVILLVGNFVFKKKILLYVTKVNKTIIIVVMKELLLQSNASDAHLCKLILFHITCLK